MNAEQLVKQGLIKKVHWIKSQLSLWPEMAGTFYLAGGSLAGPVNDLDIYPVDPANWARVLRKMRAATSILAKSPNATTFGTRPWPTQCCHYAKESLEQLVHSFDFAHIQVGACIQQAVSRWEVQEVCYTEAFLAAKALNTTWYTGSEYPMSSLVRLGKYYKRGVMHKGAYMRGVLEILEGLTSRGFTDYDDFKDQLDAVDLGLLPEDLSDVEQGSLKILFENLGAKRYDKH